MSFFDDIGDAISGAANAVASVGSFVGEAAAEVANSSIGQLALNFGGAIFGDPGLGAQVGGALKGLNSLFGGGGGGKPATRATPRGGARPVPVRPSGFTGWRGVNTADGRLYAVGFKNGKVVKFKLVRDKIVPAENLPLVRTSPAAPHVVLGVLPQVQQIQENTPGTADSIMHAAVQAQAVQAIQLPTRRAPGRMTLAN